MNFENLPIIDTAIDDVGKTTWEYIRTRYFKQAIVMLIGVVLLIICLAYIFGLILEVVFFPLLIPILSFVALKQKVHGMFMAQFAARNNFTYTPTGSVEGEHGLVFRLGYSKLLSNMVSGDFQSKPFRFFNYTYTVGHGKHQVVTYLTVFDLAISNNFPAIYLDAGKNNPVGRFSGGENTTPLEPLRLESNLFDKYYTLYATKGAHITALEIFTPDFMEYLIRLSPRFDIEINGGQLYVYDLGHIHTRKRLQEFYEVARFLLENTTRVLEKMRVTSIT